MTVHWFCPLDCSLCQDTACVAEGCKRTGHAVLAVCHGCGVLIVSTYGYCQECMQAESPAMTWPR
jgi:hypothetical protein